MVDLIMSTKLRRISLLALTFVFTIVGVIIFSVSINEFFFKDICWSGNKAFESGSEIKKYKDGYTCLCEEGEIICSQKLKTEQTALELEDFTEKNLKFSYNYITNGITQDLLNSPLQTEFVSVANLKKGVEFSILQGQLCSEENRPAVQVGLYNYSDGILTLISIINQINTVYFVPCTVEVVYSISPLQLDLKKGIKLQYSNNVGEIVRANVCVYNSKIYTEGDYYESLDGCDVCRCSNGVSKCEGTGGCN